MKDFKKLMNTSEYDFLREHERLIKGLLVQPKFENVEGAFRVVKKEITHSDVEQTPGSGTTHAIKGFVLYRLFVI